MRRLTLVDRAQGVDQPRQLAGLEDLLGVLDDVPGEEQVVVSQGDCPDFRPQRRRFLEVPPLGVLGAAATLQQGRADPAHAGLAGEFFGGRQVPEHAVPLLRGLEVQQQDDLVLEAGMGGGRGLLGLGQRRQRLAEQLRPVADGHFLLPLPVELARPQHGELAGGDLGAAALGGGFFDPAGVPVPATSTKLP